MGRPAGFSRSSPLLPLLSLLHFSSTIAVLLGPDVTLVSTTTLSHPGWMGGVPQEVECVGYPNVFPNAAKSALQRWVFLMGPLWLPARRPSATVRTRLAYSLRGNTTLHDTLPPLLCSLITARHRYALPRRGRHRCLLGRLPGPTSAHHRHYAITARRHLFGVRWFPAPPPHAARHTCASA